jgi:site-specific DNA-adenine methylase
MTYALLVFILMFILVFIKYYIDTQDTIKNLKIDRDKYRKLYWQEFINKDSRGKMNWLYKNIKEQISELIKDLKDTDFQNYDGDIKHEVIEALNSIDDYSTTIENQDMDSLIHYREKDGNTK